MSVSTVTQEQAQPVDELEAQFEAWQREDELAIAALPSDVRRSVEDACTQAGLLHDGTFEVLLTTAHLIDFERNGRQKVLSVAQRFENIKRLNEAARNLREAIGALSTDDMLDIGHAAYDCESGPGVLPEIRGKLIDRALSEAPLAMLVQVSQQILNERSQDAGKSGRRPLLSKYAYFVLCLAETFSQEGLAVGRGGAFERLCNVVFEVAGVRSTPEGAIRYYLAKRKKRDQNRPENSSQEPAE